MRSLVTLARVLALCLLLAAGATARGGSPFQPPGDAAPNIVTAELAGAELFVTGRSFGAAREPVVLFGGAQLTVKSYAPESIVAEVPASPVLREHGASLLAGEEHEKGAWRAPWSMSLGLRQAIEPRSQRQFGGGSTLPSGHVDLKVLCTLDA